MCFPPLTRTFITFLQLKNPQSLPAIDSLYIIFRLFFLKIGKKTQYSIYFLLKYQIIKILGSIYLDVYCEVFIVKTLDTVIEEYRNKMFLIAKEDGLNSHRTLIASQHLDELLNIKMAESKAISKPKENH